MSISIYICGQIASGKSTISEELSKELKLPYFKIDRYREKFTNDKDAWHEIINELKVTDSYIFESTGLSKRMEQLIINDIKFNRKFFVVKLVCSKETALMRVKTRGYTFPKWEYSISIEESIQWVDKEINKLDADLEIDTDKISINVAIKCIIDKLSNENLI